MDQTQIVNLLKILKTTTDKNILLRGLHKLRSIVGNSDGIKNLYESKGIPIIVRFLGKPKEEILEIALSILANCCSDKRCCEEAFEARVTVNLVAILKSIPNPVIQCRACRLLGNLAKTDPKCLLETSSAVIAKSICQITEETSDVGTRLMALRAARYLLTNPQFLKHFLHSNGFTIILLLLTSIMRKSTSLSQSEQVVTNTVSSGLKKNQHREKYFEEVARSLESVRSDIFDREVLKYSEQEPILYEMPIEKAALDLSFEIIKCLSIMSDMSMSLPVWTALNQKGCSLSVVAFFATEQSKHRSVALRILANFSKNTSACYILSNSNAVTTACDLLLAADMEKPLAESETRYCLNILGHLSVDACNRSKIRRSGAIRKLIIMLRDSKSQTEISYILQLLNNFQYDNLSMELMLKEGLIMILIRELVTYINSEDDYHKKRREERQERTKKRKLNEVNEQPISKFGRLSDDYVCDFESPSCSPKSSFAPSSPCSSRSMSPLFKLEGNDDEIPNEDETYSPVCSDDEEDSNSANETQENETNDIMKLLDAISTRSAENTDDEKDEDETSQDVPALKHFGNMPRSTIDVIENLIFRITLLVNKRAELGKAETISALIMAINAFGSNNNFAGALTNILLESQFFAQTVKHGVANQIYQLTKKEEIRTEAFTFLETLTCVGESNYGKAELVRLLRSTTTEDITSYKRAAITVAYIIKNRKLLLQYLCDGNALSVLLDIILKGDIDDELTAEATDALTALAKNTLNITVPHEFDDCTSFGECIDSDLEKSDCEWLNSPNMIYDMRFVLDGTKDSSDTNATDTVPTVVQFNKQILCDSSEVFHTMFNSAFRECNENEVHLQQYTVSGVKYFLKLVMISRSQEENPRYILPPKDKHFALLEAYEMSRIYDLQPIENVGRHMLIKLLDEKNCAKVLEWSMKNNHPELIECSINYYLCSAIEVKKKIQLFRTTNENSDCAAEWLEMLTEAILCRCQIS